jgi:predicted RNA-binding protein with PIN domain
MKKNYIIDGFNLGFKIPEIARWIKSGQTDRAIQLILNHVNKSINIRANQVIVVFDGRHSSNQELPAYSNITVRFSNKPQTADDIIRDFIRNCKKPEDWVVISSDSEIRHTARIMGSELKKSESFADSNKNKKQKLNPAMREKYNPNSVDVDYWLKQFGSGEDD